MAEKVKLATAVVEIISSGMGGLRQEISNTKGVLASALQGIAQQAAGVFSGIQFSNLVSGLGVFAREFTATSLRLAADAETTATAFKVLTGSAETAGEVIDKIRKFAAETPFEFPELAAAAKSLIAFGESTDTVVDSLRRIGDISSGVGAPIGEIAELYGKARVQGRLFMEDINQLTGRGIPIFQELAKQFRLPDESGVRKLIETGQVGFANLERAFFDMTRAGGDFDGMMAEQSKTAAGLWSTMKDDIGAVQRQFGELLMEAFNFKDTLKGVSDLAKAFGEAMEQSAPELRNAFKGIADSIREIGEAFTGQTEAVDQFRTALVMTASVMEKMAKTAEFLAKTNPFVLGRQTGESFGASSLSPLTLGKKVGEWMFGGGSSPAAAKAAAPALVEAVKKAATEDPRLALPRGPRPLSEEDAAVKLRSQNVRLAAAAAAEQRRLADVRFAAEAEAAKKNPLFAGLLGGAGGLGRAFDATFGGKGGFGEGVLGKAAAGLAEGIEKFEKKMAEKVALRTVVEIPAGVFQGNSFFRQLQDNLIRQTDPQQMLVRKAEEQLDVALRTKAIQERIRDILEKNKLAVASG